jgi:hypothetical protein
MNDDRQSKRGISVHFKLSSFDFMIGSAGGIQFRFTGSDNAFPSPREDVMLVTVHYIDEETALWLPKRY